MFYKDAGGVHMKSRKLVSILKARLAEDKPLIQVLLGPRQVGKTTAVKEVLGNGFYETADYPVPLNFSHIQLWWEKAKGSKDKLLAIDEVQKIPGWSEIIKKLWDGDPSLKVILTGSSSLLVEKGLKETLAGRYEIIRAEHWNYDEARDVFSQTVKSFVEFGCYPGSMRFLHELTRWGEYVRDSIIEPVLGRDLLQLHPVDNPALLRQVFGVAASLPAQIVSLQKIQGQLQTKGSLPTISSYLKLLADAYLVTGVEKYYASDFRARQSSPKLFVHDNALIRSLRRPIGQALSPVEWGHYFENAVGARFIESGWETYYWSERDKEVDLVVIGPKGEKWALEVKSQAIQASELSSLKHFCEKHPGFEPHLVSMVDQKIEGIKCLSAHEVLRLSRNPE
jgi:predicted AAA+ superfamily ATPase